VRKMKQYQNGNPVPHAMSTATGSSSVSRTNQNTGPPTVASYFIRHKRFACTYHFWTGISPTDNSYCFTSVPVSLNSRQSDVQDRFKFNQHYCWYQDVEVSTSIKGVFHSINPYVGMTLLYTVWNPLHVFPVQNDLSLFLLYLSHSRLFNELHYKIYFARIRCLRLLHVEYPGKKTIPRNCLDVRASSSSIIWLILRIRFDLVAGDALQTFAVS